MPYHTIDAHTQLVGIIGSPVGHSLSPVMHNAAYAALDLNWRYVALPVRSAQQLGAALHGLSALGFRGVNITVPYKVEALHYMDSVTDNAKQIGAINTVIINQFTGELRGANTDGDGFLDDLAAHGFKPDKFKLNKEDHYIVLGAGGAARAVVMALASHGARLTVVNRTLENASALAEAFDVEGASYTDLPRLLPDCRLIVNTTSVGLHPDSEASPLPPGVTLPPGAFVYDTIYRPFETRLMRDARAAGLIATNGLGMLINQGARAASMWTGRTLDTTITAIMREACLQALSESAVLSSTKPVEE